MVGPIFELQPSNLVRIPIFLSCKNAENFVTKSQVVLELAKISVSVLSISWGFLDLVFKYLSHLLFEKSAIKGNNVEKMGILIYSTTIRNLCLKEVRKEVLLCFLYVLTRPKKSLIFVSYDEASINWKVRIQNENSSLCDKYVWDRNRIVYF